jgi:phosphatidate cytidylyltransferase
LLLVAGLGAALSDICAFTVGKLFGKHLISPPVNPRKAWEGLLGDVLGALLTVLLFRFVLPPSFTWIELAILGLIIGLGSAWGDLISSLAKRASDVKDWGGLLPGHGGLLDRANSFVVVLPSVYYYLVLLKFFGWI